MDNEDLSIITKRNSLQIYNSEINENDNNEIDYNSLFSFIINNNNNNNNELQKENLKLKKIINDLFSMVKEFNDKIENLKKELS
jgi:hypothetical protein